MAHYDVSDLSLKKSSWFEILELEEDTDADRTSDLFIAQRSQGVMFHVIIDNEANTAGFTPKVVVPNPVSGGSDLVVAAFSELTADGEYILVLHPAATNMGDEGLVGTLPREWKLLLNYSTGTPATDSADTRVFARYI